ncbi:MAG: hypothetical protein P1U34_03530 [Coxiellaceae bacterium]|nr:hypothetical protein [Coxiellaceae bacterium]
MSRSSTTDLWQAFCVLAHRDDIDFGKHNDAVKTIAGLPSEFPRVFMKEKSEADIPAEPICADVLIDRISAVATHIHTVDGSYTASHEFFVKSGELWKQGINSRVFIRLKSRSEAIAKLAEEKMTWPPIVSDHTSFSYTMLRAFNGLFTAEADFTAFTQVQPGSWFKNKANTALLDKLASVESQETARITVEGCLQACRMYIDGLIARAEIKPPPSPITFAEEGVAEPGEVFAEQYALPSILVGGNDDDDAENVIINPLSEPLAPPPTSLSVFSTPPSPIVESGPAVESKPATTAVAVTATIDNPVEHAKAMLTKLHNYIHTTQKTWGYFFSDMAGYTRYEQTKIFKRIVAMINDPDLPDEMIKHRQELEGVSDKAFQFSRSTVPRYCQHITDEHQAKIWPEFHEMVMELVRMLHRYDDFSVEDFRVALTEIDFEMTYTPDHSPVTETTPLLS